MPQQYDMFGGCEEIKESERKPTNKYRTMQELHGITEGKQCKSCVHLMDSGYHNRQYYKCELWKISHGSATDVRLKNQACGKYKAQNEESSIEKQRRLSCYVGNGVDNWDCYRDCSFWNGKRCTH